jgi:hypothetical protein
MRSLWTFAIPAVLAAEKLEVQVALGMAGG